MHRSTRTLKRRGLKRFGDGSSVWILDWRSRSRGRKLDVGFRQPPAVIRTLEFLDEALEEAEEAARWYSRRSRTAAIGFSDELDVAIAQIERAPTAWPNYEHNTRRYLLRRFPYSVMYRVEASKVVIVAVAHARRRPGY